jgi:hypothetical protein
MRCCVFTVVLGVTVGSFLMEESLSNWIKCLCRDLLECERIDDLDLQTSIILVGQYMLENQSISRLEEIEESLKQEPSKNSPDEFEIIKLIAKFAVSSDCRYREDFVSHIISMPEIIQTHLMLAIQNENTDDHEFLPECTDERQFFSPDMGCSQCSECIMKDKELANHINEIANFVERERKLEEQMKVEYTTHLNKMMDLESNLSEKSSIIRELTVNLSTAKKIEADLACEQADKIQLQRQLSTLQDQVDSLSQMGKRAENAEKLVDRLKEKIDRYEGLAEQLKCECAAHQETHTKLIQSEQELDSLRKVKQHLEEYRKRCAENAITIADLTERLGTSEDDIRRLNSQLTDAIQGKHLVESTAQLLSSELLAASEIVRDSERGVGVGEYRQTALSHCALTCSRDGNQRAQS